MTEDLAQTILNLSIMILITVICYILAIRKK